jgi:hypothetical protein
VLRLVRAADMLWRRVAQTLVYLFIVEWQSSSVAYQIYMSASVVGVEFLWEQSVKQAYLTSLRPLSPKDASARW